DDQHNMLCLAVAEYPPLLLQVLRDDCQAPKKAVLDLGCGTGAWLAQVATDFPHVDAVGVDLVPRDPQMTSEIDDINLGLEHFYGELNDAALHNFDVVNARLISAGVKDYARLIDQISRVLRPGGLVILREGDFRVYDEKRETFPLPQSSDFRSLAVPAVAHVVGHMRQSIQARGGHVEAASFLHLWMDQHAAFTDVVHHEVDLPLCPVFEGDSAEAKKQRNIGPSAQDDIQSFIESGRPLLLESDLTHDEVDDLLFRAGQELADCRRPCFMRLQCVYARKL
ncbi:hypothetical protein AURDEDRAFT_58721, partial [Auricularia subglabra TFB-10046 SS5]